MGLRQSKHLPDDVTDGSSPYEDPRHHQQPGRKASSISILVRGREVSAERLRRHIVRHLGYSTLSLAMRGLEEVPLELWEVRELQKLNLSLNCLSALPPGLGRLQSLVVLNLSGNELSSLPAELSLLRNLRVLFAYRNQLSEVRVLANQTDDSLFCSFCTFALLCLSNTNSLLIK